MPWFISATSPRIKAIHTNLLDDVLNSHIQRLDRWVHDQTGDGHAYLRFLYHISLASSKFCSTDFTVYGINANASFLEYGTTYE